MVVPQDVHDRTTAEWLNQSQWICDNVGGWTRGTVSGNKAGKSGSENVRYVELPVTVWHRGSLGPVATEPVPWIHTALEHGKALTAAIHDRVVLALSSKFATALREAHIDPKSVCGLGNSVSKITEEQADILPFADHVPG